MYLEDYIRVIYVDMPITIKAYTIPDGFGYYNVYLNSRHSYEQNEISFHHELFHIKNGDYDKQISIGLIEIFAHQNY